MGKKGIFIVIEGLDGSGKTTQAKLLAKKLEKTHNVLLTAEPSCGKTGSFIREDCLYEDKRLPTEAEALLCPRKNRAIINLARRCFLRNILLIYKKDMTS